ncbi:hypothetical protein, conserved [Eimeria praecox]|uniref:Uncharacterized protein n=1 Tax=Eimeria praecox TaxID=51316 RepID=U6H496_9EIME|nr:hypothetical protein, conserved [Eimeria praecox]
MESAEAYEEIADDFVTTALTDPDGKKWDPDEKELLWGSRPPILPCRGGDSLFGDRGDSSEEEYDEEYEEGDGDYSDEDGYEETDSRRGDTPMRRRNRDNSMQGQRLEQLLEEYRDEYIGELDPEEAEESDSFSAYEECFDDFLKSQER